MPSKWFTLYFSSWGSFSAGLRSSWSAGKRAGQAATGGAGAGMAPVDPSRAALGAEPRSRMGTRGPGGCQGSAHTDRASESAFADPSFNLSKILRGLGVILVLCLLAWWGCAVPGVPGAVGTGGDVCCVLQHISFNPVPAQRNPRPAPRAASSPGHKPLQNPLSLHRATCRNRFSPSIRRFRSQL